MDDVDGAFAYWSFIEKYLPKYYTRNDVLESNILSRYLDESDACEEDLPWIAELGTREDVVAELIEIDSSLIKEALEAYLLELYKT